MKTRITLFLSLAFCSMTMAADLPDFPFVHSAGTASTNVAPDAAVITLAINVHAETASNAVAVVEGTGSEMIEVLGKKHGITSGITANNLNKSPVHRRGDNYELLEIIGYTVTRSITIEVNDIKTFPSVMQLLASMEHVTNINAEFKYSDHEAISRALTAQACMTAKADAQLLAESSGVQLGGLFAISQDGLADLGTKFRPRSYATALYGADIVGLDESINFFIPDTIEYKASVSTIFKLK